MNHKIETTKNITYENFTKTILALSFAFTTTYTFAQTAYEKTMMPKVQTIEMPKPNPDDYTAQTNDFARIGDKEKHFGNRIITPLFRF